jgi:hypothetical protein
MKLDAWLGMGTGGMHKELRPGNFLGNNRLEVKEGDGQVKLRCML